MLPNTFINFISFVKSSEGITMMRKEYKTKLNYEQMRNDYFCFIPWNRLNIFEILKPNRDCIQELKEVINIYTKLKNSDWKIYKLQTFHTASISFLFQDLSHIKYVIWIILTKQCFFSIHIIDFVGHGVHPYYRQEESDIKLICYFWIHEEIKMKQVIP